MIRIVIAAMVLMMSGVIHAGDWPAKPVHIVVPFPAGGGTDIPARLLGERLSKIWKEAVIVDNKPGAGGALGAAEAARAPADGYTLLFPSGSIMTAHQFVYSKLPYDPERDFAPIMNVVSSPQVIVVSAKSPYATIEQLISAAKDNPGKLTFGHAGIGSQSHLANEYFLREAKISATSVAYKGDPPAAMDIIGGRVDFSVLSLSVSLPQIRAGKLRALGVTSAVEIPQLPGVRPIGNVLPGFENLGWFGLVAPANVPVEVLRKIHQDAKAALEDPEVRAKLDAAGFRIVANSADSMAQAMGTERKRWAALVKERNLRME